MKLDTVLPAGGRISGEFAREVGVDVKALISIGGRTILRRTLETLRATGRAGRIVVVGPPETGPEVVSLADAVIPETDSGAGNILRGLEWLRAANAGKPSERVLILTTDLPFLTPEAIAGFLDACPAEKDICIPILEREEFELRFQRAAGRYIRLRDGEWTIGCAFLVNPEAVQRNERLVTRTFAARRSHLAMARLLGPMFILRFLTRRLTVSDVEAKCLQMLGCTGAAIRGCAPELGFDIDYHVDYRYAADRLA